jgi:hypothetical protein
MHAAGGQADRVALSREISYDYGKDSAEREYYAKHNQTD